MPIRSPIAVGLVTAWQASGDSYWAQSNGRDTVKCLACSNLIRRTLWTGWLFSKTAPNFDCFWQVVCCWLLAACSGATTQGANQSCRSSWRCKQPYKSGGDSYTNLKMSTDPKVNTTAPKSGRDQANLQLNSLNWLPLIKNLRYFTPVLTAGRAEKEAELPIITTKTSLRLNRVG